MGQIMFKLNVILLKFFVVLILIGLAASCSFKYPAIQKKFFSWTLSKEQLTEIKSILESNGYKKITLDDYLYEGAYVTQYMKEINTSKKISNNRVQIMMSFKTNDLSTGMYRNFGFSIFNLDYDNIPEINMEMDKMEKIIHNKLIELVGKDNIEKR